MAKGSRPKKGSDLSHRQIHIYIMALENDSGVIREIEGNFDDATMDDLQALIVKINSVIQLRLMQSVLKQPKDS